MYSCRKSGVRNHGDFKPKAQKPRPEPQRQRPRFALDPDGNGCCRKEVLAASQHHARDQVLRLGDKGAWGEDGLALRARFCGVGTWA